MVPQGESAAQISANRPPMMVARDWRPLQKNTLLGFFSLELASGLVLRDCALHQKNDRRWVSLAAKLQLNPDGTPRIGDKGKALYSPIVEIPDPARREAFQRAAVSAIEKLRRERPAR
jgi:hypothetical protein